MKRSLKQRPVLSVAIVSSFLKSELKRRGTKSIILAGHLIAQCPENTNPTFPNTNRSRSRCFNCQQVVGLYLSVMPIRKHAKLTS